MRAAEARVWFVQAESDLRAATALNDCPHHLRGEDVGCHLAAMCAQVVEKSLKGYLILNGVTPVLGHRPDKYLMQLLLRGGPLLRHKNHHSHLSRLFDKATRSEIEGLLDLTPGGQAGHTDVPNTEYPWQVDGAWAKTPVGAKEFDGPGAATRLRLAKKVLDKLHQLSIAAQRGEML